MPYKNAQQQKLAMARSEKRVAGVVVREPLPPIQINSPRQALRAIADAVNKVRADGTLDQLTVSRLQIEGAKIANMILASQLDSKLDELAAKVKELTDARDGNDKPKMPPLALPSGESVIDATFTDATSDAKPDVEPLMGVNTNAPTPTAPVRRPPGRPRKDGRPPGSVPKPIPKIPNSAQFEAFMDAAVAAAGDDDE